MNKQRTKRRRRLFVLVILLFVPAVLCVHWQIREKNLLLNPQLISEDAVCGVDLSHHQGEVDMAALKAAGVQFAYLKATEGSTHKDENFAENRQAADANTLPNGAYHFFSFTSSGVEQAAHFIETVGEIDGHLIPAVDVEYYGEFVSDPPSEEAVVRELQAFLDAIEEAYGVKAIIYTPRLTYHACIQDHFQAYPKWVRSVYYPPFVYGMRDWTIWQYSDRGALPGVSTEDGFIDLDVLHGKTSVEDLMK